MDHKHLSATFHFHFYRLLLCGIEAESESAAQPMSLQLEPLRLCGSVFARLWAPCEVTCVSPVDG